MWGDGRPIRSVKMRVNKFITVYIIDQIGVTIIVSRRILRFAFRELDKATAVHVTIMNLDFATACWAIIDQVNIAGILIRSGANGGAIVQEGNRVGIRISRTRSCSPNICYRSAIVRSANISITADRQTQNIRDIDIYRSAVAQRPVNIIAN